jgi:putative ABC transport system permease protein
MSLWSLALRNVRRNARRSALTGGVVILGFAAFALAGGFMAQTFEGLREGTIRGGYGHLQIAEPEFFAGNEERTLEHGLARAGEAETVLGRDREVRAVLPQIDFVGLATNGTRSVPYLGVGVDPRGEAETMDFPSLLTAGRWLSPESGGEVVLGTGLARALGVAPGATITLLATTRDGILNAVDATVAGLLDVRVRELNDRYLATSLSLASRLLGVSGTVSKLIVVLREPADARRALPRLLEALRGAGFPLAGRTWSELAPFYGQVRLYLIEIFSGLGIVLVVVVLLATMNTMLMAAAERTREIGTLRAIGTRPKAIARMFVTEGAVLALAGCLAGSAISLLLTSILNHSGIILPPPPGGTHGVPLHMKVYGIAYGTGAVAMFATSMLATYFPARRAARMRIIDALSYV